MQGLLGERLFSVFDANKDGCVDIREFTKAAFMLFDNEFAARLKLVFDILDVNSDGFIASEDVRRIVSHLPLKRSVRSS